VLIRTRKTETPREIPPGCGVQSEMSAKSQEAKKKNFSTGEAMRSGPAGFLRSSNFSRFDSCESRLFLGEERNQCLDMCLSY
jgi:hypothetical protein